MLIALSAALCGRLRPARDRRGRRGGHGTAVDNRTTGAQVEDQTIEMKALRALSADAELKEQAHLNVTSYNSVVLLTGETPTPALRRRAVALIKRVDKVTHIYDEIIIAPAQFAGLP